MWEVAVAYPFPAVVYLEGWNTENVPKNICLWAAISWKLAPVESVICEQRGEKDFGQPVSAVSNWLRMA
jgi:hypothetical protein